MSTLDEKLYNADTDTRLLRCKRAVQFALAKVTYRLFISRSKSKLIFTLNEWLNNTNIKIIPHGSNLVVCQTTAVNSTPIFYYGRQASWAASSLATLKPVNLRRTLVSPPHIAVLISWNRVVGQWVDGRLWKADSSRRGGLREMKVFATLPTNFIPRHRGLSNNCEGPSELSEYSLNRLISTQVAWGIQKGGLDVSGLIQNCSDTYISNSALGYSQPLRFTITIRTTKKTNNNFTPSITANNELTKPQFRYIVLESGFIKRKLSSSMTIFFVEKPD